MSENFSPAEHQRGGAPSIVSLRDVRLALGEGATRVNVLQGLTLDFPRGLSTAVVGPSGCGKSTLLMTIAGLERIDSGEIFVDGARIDAMGEDGLATFRSQRIGIVFQSFHLMPTLTALENVALPLELTGRAKNIFARAEAELARVGLSARKNHFPAQMSGGEQQRVALARALVGDPDLILADEPTGNLDETTGAGIIDLIFEQRRARGASLILVTHDKFLAERCDEQVRMRDGRIESTRKIAPAGGA